MGERLGPRACAVCGPGGIQGCWRCGATMGHRHIEIVDRHGKKKGRAAACATHAPDDGVLVRATRKKPAASPSVIAKRRRDRERRRAHRLVLDRHASEVQTELARIRGEVDGA